MAQRSQSVAMVAVDTSGLKQLATVLRKAQPEVKKQLFKSLRSAGQIVMEEARFNALWSSRIGGSLVVQGSGLHVKVVARGAIAPEAGPLENKGDAGTFRHPVFGNRDVWVAQPAHPFLAPALASKFNEVVEVVNSAVDEALIVAGFNH